MVNVTEIVLETSGGEILREGVLSEVLEKLSRELDKSKQNPQMRIAIRVGREQY